MKRQLADKQCIPCREGRPPLAGEALSEIAAEIDAGWRVVAAHHIEREFHFRDFREALAFVNGVGELAEQQGHHPDMELSWGLVKVSIHTHKIDGLTESDFVLAAMIDRIETPAHT